MKYQGILFDFNGTMFFDSPMHHLAWKQVSKELRGYEITDEEMNAFLHGKNNEKIIDYIMKDAINLEKNKEYSVYKEAVYRELCLSQAQPLSLAPGLVNFLDWLKEHHVPITIASASIRDNIDFYIKTFELERWFDTSKIVYDDGTHKDKVTMFQEAAKRLDIAIEECLVFEDSLSGIRFAHAAGAKDIIAMDSMKQPERYQQFPYLKAIWDDFQNAQAMLEFITKE